MRHETNANSINNTIWINPFELKLFSPPPNWWWYSRLEKRIKIKIIKKFLEKIALGKLYYGGNWDLSAKQFKDTDWKKNVRSLKLNYEDYKKSSWYQFINSQIKKNGFYYYKKNKIKNIDELNEFFEKYLKKLIKSIETDGFILENYDDKDVPKVLISRDGNLIKTGNGCHRLAIIQEFSIKCKYPIQIVGIHKKFNINGVKSNLLQLKDIYRFISDEYSMNFSNK